jgi:hypothetical protein
VNKENEGIFVLKGCRSGNDDEINETIYSWEIKYFSEAQKSEGKK